MIRLINGTICARDKLITGQDLVIRQGRIFFEKRNSDRKDENIIDLNGSYILPGFVELHTHGASLFEFTAGRYDPQTKSFQSSVEIYEEELPRYVRVLTSNGVTNLYLGTWAAPVKQLRFCFEQLKKYMDSDRNGRDGYLIKGGLLEGAFLNPEMCGAMNADYVLPPGIEKFDEINESGVIKLVNVVPDYGEASYKLIRNLTEKGISVGAGHTNATADQFRAAVDNGLKYAIHFLNGLTGRSFKSFDNGGAVEGILQDSRIYVELILDGVHVNPAYVRDVIERKGIDKVMAVTDAMFVSQAKGVTDFQMNGIPGRLSEDGKYVYVASKKPLTLFSSILTMDRAFSNLLSFLTKEMPGVWYHEHKSMSLERAVPAAARMCATNACNMLKMYGAEDPWTGSIEEGKWADLLVADIEGQPGNYRLSIRKVFVRGNEVYSSARV